MSFIKRLLFGFASLGIFFLLVNSQISEINAIEFNGIGGKPVNSEIGFNYQAGLGAKINDQIYVANSTDEDQTILIYAADIVSASAGGVSCSELNADLTATGSWLAIDQTEIFLESETGKNIDFTINVPNSVEPGEYNACIVVQPLEINSDDTATEEGVNEIKLNFRTANRVKITVPGEVNPRLEVVDFTAIYNQRKLKLIPVVKNTGNVSVDFTLETNTENQLNQNNFRTSEDYSLVPGQESTWEYELNLGDLFGIYASELTIIYENNEAEPIILTTNKDVKQLDWGGFLNGGSLIILPHIWLALVGFGGVGILVSLIITVFAFFYNRDFWKKEFSKWKPKQIEEGSDIKIFAEKYNLDWRKIAWANNLIIPFSLKDKDTLLLPINKLNSNKYLNFKNLKKTLIIVNTIFLIIILIGFIILFMPNTTAATNNSLSSLTQIEKTTNTAAVLAADTEFQQVINTGVLVVDIVDNLLQDVASPSISMGAETFSFACQTATGTLGSATEQIYIENPDAADNGWTLSIAADNTTSFWDSTASDYDFNDGNGSPAGCTDGPDADNLAGQMTIDASVATLGTGNCASCGTTGITKGSSASFEEGTVDNITLLSAGSSSDDIGDFTLQGVTITQTLPPEQAATGDYSISMTMTIIAL